MAASTKQVTDQLENEPTAVSRPVHKEVSVFSNIHAFADAQRMAQLIAASDLIPDQYRGNVANTTIALEMAQRIGASPMAVMQNLYIVHGKPGWSAQFIIAALNSCGRYSPIRFVIEGEGNAASCYAWVYDLDNNKERIDGPRVSIEMAKAEGWFQKKGSKWQTMPDIMLRYRAASFFGKMYAPEILMGMQTAEELDDIVELTPDNNGVYEVPDKGVAGVADKLKEHNKANPASDVPPASKPEPEPESEPAPIECEVVDKATGEISENANDKLKEQLQKKTGKTTNTKNANPDQF